MVSDERIARFREMGLDQVRVMVHSRTLPSDWMFDAAEWVGDQERSDREAKEASQAAQERLALRASKDARTASIAAIIAVIVSTIGTVIALLAWLFPRPPAP